MLSLNVVIFFFSSRRRHTRCSRDWSSDVCSSDLTGKRADKVKQPKFKNKSQRQSARFTKGSFSFENGVLNLSKIGDIHISWYRRVHGEPSSLPLSMTPSGSYYLVSVLRLDRKTTILN